MDSAGGWLKRRLRAREPVFAAWTSLGHPSITEAFTGAGVDFIGIDLEHSTISQEQAQRLIAAAQAGGAACLPRVSSHNGEQIKRLLDSGADGIIAPNVSTPAEVAQIAKWLKYPPEGARGFGVSRAQGYGREFDDYVSSWNRRSALILQIESARAAGRIGALLAHDAVDGVMVGPYDMSGSLGIPGQLTHPKVAAACRHVIEACRQAGKACGTQIIEPDLRSVAAAFDQGYSFVVLASDVFVLWKWGERMRGIIHASRAARTYGLPGRGPAKKRVPPRLQGARSRG
jgi:2-dehydro-3-deoxyglucarate aldolase